MEYGVGVKNRYALFMGDEDQDPLEVIAKGKENKEEHRPNLQRGPAGGQDGSKKAPSTQPSSSVSQTSRLAGKTHANAPQGTDQKTALSGQGISSNAGANTLGNSVKQPLSRAPGQKTASGGGGSGVGNSNADRGQEGKRLREQNAATAGQTQPRPPRTDRPAADTRQERPGNANH